EVLEGGRRERALVRAVLVDRGQRLGRRLDEAVRRAELLAVPAHPAEAQGAGEVHVALARVDEVAALAVDLALRLVEDVAQQRQIVLGVVDRRLARARRGPADARVGRARGLV